MITIEPVLRKFTYNGTDLPDPNPDLSIGEVQQLHAAAYPELLTAKPHTEMKGGREVTTFHVAVGTKG